MGNCPQNLDTFALSKHPWRKTSNPGIVYDPLSNIYATVFTSPSITQKQLQALRIRSTYREFLVQIYGVLLPEGKKSFPADLLSSCSEDSQPRIIMEIIQYRLPDLGPLSYDTGLYILKQCLTASRILYRYFGYFSISQESIGFNGQGKCKMWINSNYTLCEKKNSQPQAGQSLPPSFPFDPYEKKIVQDLFLMIEEKMLPSLNNEQTKQYNQKKKQILSYNHLVSPQLQKKTKVRQNGGKYSYTFSKGLTFVNLLCTIRNINKKEFKVDLPQGAGNADLQSDKVTRENNCSQDRISLKHNAQSKNQKSLRQKYLFNGEKNKIQKKSKKHLFQDSQSTMHSTSYSRLKLSSTLLSPTTNEKYTQEKRLMSQLSPISESKHFFKRKSNIYGKLSNQLMRSSLQQLDPQLPS